NRKYNREPIPDELRDAALEMSRRYPPSLLQRVLRIQPCRLMPKAKTSARRSKRQQAQTAFFKLPPPLTQAPTESLSATMILANTRNASMTVNPTPAHLRRLGNPSR